MRIGREAVCKPRTQLLGGYEMGITIYPRQAVQRAKKGEIGAKWYTIFESGFVYPFCADVQKPATNGSWKSHASDVFDWP